jgi:hypothetical protein
MNLRHATPARNFASIWRRGLLTAKSKGRLPVVWLHAASRSTWAVLHTMKRHGCKEVYAPGESRNRSAKARTSHRSVI